MAFENFYITTKGKRLLAKAQVGAAISFTKAQIGSGTLTEGTDILGLTSLIQSVKELNISGLSVSKESAQITMGFSNEGVSAPFYWKEIGLFANDPDEGEILYAYGYAGDNPDYISTYSAAPMEFLFTMIVQISGAAEVTAVIDESLLYCTLDHVKNPSHCFYGVSTGTGDAFTLTMENISLQDGLFIRLKLHTDLVAGATLDLNGTGAKPIIYANGDAVTAGALGGNILLLSYDNTRDSWIVNPLPLMGTVAIGPMTAGGVQDPSLAQMRNISAGTQDLTAGTSPLATGDIYFVYE